MIVSTRKKGYKVIDSQIIEGNLIVGAFISPDQTKIILQLFNEGDSQDFSIDIPIGATNISHYVTSNSASDNFSLYNDISFDKYYQCEIENINSQIKNHEDMVLINTKKTEIFFSN